MRKTERKSQTDREKQKGSERATIRRATKEI